MPGIGEARKFISPQDREALTKANDAIKEAGGDEQKRREMIDARQHIKEQISINIEREIYRRAEVFGRFLLELVEKHDDIPWDDLKVACREGGGYSMNKLKKDAQYSGMVAMIEGLTGEQQEIFGNILDDVKLGICARNAVIDFAQQEIRNKRYGRELAARDRECGGEVSDDELGEMIFRSCNTRSNPKFNSPIGKVHLVRANKLCIQLNVEEQEDVQMLHGSQADISDKSTQSGKNTLGGFLARTKRFCDPETGKLIIATALVVRYSPTSGIVQEDGLIEEIEKHEKGHLLNEIVRSSFKPGSRNIPERQHISEYRDTKYGVKELPVIEKAYNESADKEVQLQRYCKHLKRLQRYFFEKTRDELLADYQATGSFSYIKNLIRPKGEQSENVLCFLYDNEFAGRMSGIPPQLIKEIRNNQQEYMQVTTRQVAAAERVLAIINQAPDSEQLRRQFYAILQDTALYNWEDRLNYLYREEITKTNAVTEIHGQVANQHASSASLFTRIAARFKALGKSNKEK